MRTTPLMLPLLGLWAASHALAQEEPAPAAEDAAPVEEAQPDEPPEAGPVRYVLQPAKSWLYVMVFNDDDRWTPVQGHDHGVRATTFTGSVVWDANDPSACKVEIQFPVTALEIDPPGMRERAKLPAEGAVGDGAKKTIIGNMLGKSQLRASDFPQVSYSATACSGTEGSVDVTGTLSIRGVGKSVSVPMQVTLGEGSFAAKGAFTLSHGDFGMSPFTYGPATPKNQDKLVFHVDVVGDAE